MQDEPHDTGAPEPVDTKRPWIAPAIERMSANDAKDGIDPIVPDGTLSFGS